MEYIIVRDYKQEGLLPHYYCEFDGPYWTFDITKATRFPSEEAAVKKTEECHVFRAHGLTIIQAPELKEQKLPSIQAVLDAFVSFSSRNIRIRPVDYKAWAESRGQLRRDLEKLGLAQYINWEEV